MPEVQVPGADPANTFDYVFLGDVDPNFTPVPDGAYNLRVVKSGLAEITYRRGKKAGQVGQAIKMTFAVTDDPDYSGRRIFETLFPGDFALRSLRRLMDATGVQQQPDEALAEWLPRLAVEAATFRVPVSSKDGTDASGNPTKNNVIAWNSVSPAI